ncbi:polyadenylate-binding protein-interacting protein 7 isoform X2 [Physcomitrium patens]
MQAVDGDEAMASGQLDAMAGLKSAPVEREGGKDGSTGDGLRPAEAMECEENDVYLKFRREALRLSRARGKYARNAHNAYMAGDHADAKLFSREAHENWKTAELGHAQAAEEILYSRNAGGTASIWSIDLHGLHATEAVMALQERLTHLEKELAKDRAFIYRSQRVPGPPLEVKGQGSGVKELNSKEEHSSPLAASRAVVKNELSVITGVGRHSKGGPSLPLAVRNFLLSHGYKFTEPGVGVVSVSPKRHYAPVS